MYYLKETVDNYFYFDIFDRCTSPLLNYFLIRLENKQSRLISAMIATKQVVAGLNSDVDINARRMKITFKASTIDNSELLINGSLFNNLDNWQLLGSTPPTHVSTGGARLTALAGIKQNNINYPKNTQVTISFNLSEVVAGAHAFINCYGANINITSPANQSYSFNVTTTSSDIVVNFFNLGSGEYVVKNISVKKTVASAEKTFTNLKENSEMTVKVYEQTSSNNTNPLDNSVIGLRWQGLAVLPGTSEVEYQQHADPSSQNYVYFKD